MDENSNSGTKRSSRPKAAEVQAARRNNIKIVAEEAGGLTQLAERMGLGSSSFLSQLLRGHRSISDATARRIEDAGDKPRYWLDEPRFATTGIKSPAFSAKSRIEEPRPLPVEPSFVAASAQAVEETQRELDVRLAPEPFAEVVSLVYRDAQRAGAIDPEYVRRLVRLASK